MIGRKSLLSSKTKKASEKRWAPPTFKADSKQMTLAILTEGISFSAAVRFCQKISVKPIDRNEFVKNVLEMGPIIEKMAQESCKNALDEMPPGGIAHDGSWNARRNASHLFFNVLSIDTGKVVYYLVVSKKADVTMIPFEPSAPSNLMEKVALDFAVEVLSKNPKITFRVSDLDLKSAKVFEYNTKDEIEAGVIQSFFDGGHMKKHIIKEFENFRKKYQCGTKIEKHIGKRFAYCISIDNMDVEERVKMWNNSVEYFISKDSSIPENSNPLIKGYRKKGDKNYIPPEQLRENLQKFLNDFEFAIRKSCMGRTCGCEGINGQKVRIAPKNYKSGYTFRVKMAIVVLMWNDPLHYYDRICEECSVNPINEELHSDLLKEAEKRVKENSKRRTKEFHISRAISRTKSVKVIAKPSTEGHTTTQNKDIEAKIKKEIKGYSIAKMHGGFMNDSISDAFTTILHYLSRTNIFYYIKFGEDDNDEFINLLTSCIVRMECDQIIAVEDVQKLMLEIKFPKIRYDFEQTYLLLMNHFMQNYEASIECIYKHYFITVSCSLNCDVCGFTKTTEKKQPFITLDTLTEKPMQEQISKLFDCDILIDCPICRNRTCMQKESVLHWPFHLLIVVKENKTVQSKDKEFNFSNFNFGTHSFSIQFVGKLSSNKTEEVYYGYSMYDDKIIYHNGARCYETNDLKINSEGIVFISYEIGKIGEEITYIPDLEDEEEEEDNNIEVPQDDEFYQTFRK